MYKDFNEMMSSVGCTGAQNSRMRRNTCSTNSTQENTCPIKKGDKWGLVNYPLAMVYSPIQNFNGLYDKETALSRGTMFEGLDLPFEGESVYKGGCSRG